MAKLSAKRRKNLPSSVFAIPEQRKYPVMDKRHAVNALVRAAQHGSPDEQAKVKAAVARRYPTLPSSKKRKADKVMAAKVSGDIELGSYGSKWRHGWIPLNAAATSLKLKQLRAGGKSHSVNGHEIHVAPNHRGSHSALIVHPNGTSHYVEHASSRGALLTAKRHPSVAAPKPSTKAPDGYKLSTKRDSFTTHVHTKDNEYVGSVEKRAEGRYVAHHESTIGGNASETSYKFHGQAVNGLVNQHQANREADTAKYAAARETLARRKREGTTPDQIAQEVRLGPDRARAEEKARQAHSDWVHERERKNTANAGKTTSEGVDKVATKKTSAKTSKTTRGHYLIAEHRGEYNYADKKVGESTFSIHRVSKASSLGQPEKVEHFDQGRRGTEDYNPTRYKYGGTIPGDAYNAVAFGRSDKRKFASREEAKAHLETLRGETPKRVVRVPAGLKVEQRKTTYGAKKHFIVHEGSDKTIGQGTTKANAENVATHLGKTGIDFRQDADKVVAEMKAASSQRGEDPNHPMSLLANMGYSGVPHVYEGELTGNLSPHTPPSVARMSRAEKQDKALSLVQETLSSKDATPAESLDKSNVRIGQKVSYTLTKPGSPGEGTPRTGRVWHADGNRVFVTSKDPATGKIEMHSGYLGSHHFDVENTQQQKEAFEMERRQHGKRIAESQVTRPVLGTRQVDVAPPAGRSFSAGYKKTETVYGDPVPVTPQAYGTREGKSFRTMAEMFAAADAEFKKRRKAKVPA